MTDENISSTTPPRQVGPALPPIRNGPQFPLSKKAQGIPDLEDRIDNTPSVATSPPNLNNFDDASQSLPPPASDIHERVRIPGFPVAPSHVHGPSNRYPSFPLDPTHPMSSNLHPMNNNGEPQMKPAMVHFPQSGLMMPDRPESEQPPHFGSGMPPRSDAISPLIPPRPGPFMPPPNRHALPQGPHFNRIPQGAQGRPWKGPPPFPFRQPAGSQPMPGQHNHQPMGPPFMLPNASPIENSVGTYNQPTQPSSTVAQKTKPHVMQTLPTTIAVPPTTAAPALKPSHNDLDKSLLESIMNAVKWSDSSSSSSVCQRNSKNISQPNLMTDFA